MSPKTQRTDGGWLRAGLAVLVTGVLGGGVLTLARDQSTPRKVTADGMTGPRRSASAEKPLDVATAPPSADEKAKADPVVGDKVTVGSDGGSVTVSAVEDSVSAGQLFGAGPGQKYVAAEVKACSGPHEKNLSFEPGYFMLRLDDGTMRDHGPGAKKPELAGGTVPAGKCLSGWVTFTVPEKAFASGVVYDGSHRMTWTVPLPKGARPTTTTTGKAGAGAGATTTTTDGSDIPPTTKPKATTTTTARGAASAKAGAGTTTTAKPAAATTATSKGTTTTATTTGKPAGSTTTTQTAPKATTTTTGPGAMPTSPTAPTG